MSVQAIIDTYSGKKELTLNQMTYACDLIESRKILQKLDMDYSKLWEKVKKMSVKQYRYMLALTYEGEDRKLKELLK